MAMEYSYSIHRGLTNYSIDFRTGTTANNGEGVRPTVTLLGYRCMNDATVPLHTWIQREVPTII